ncbi:hypothetical protein EGW08_013121, partial [Elysia chlorotica]
KVSDGDRGYERFGRTLAEEHKTSWQEYWPFLDAFADLRSRDGLNKMETFLLKQRVLLLMQAMASWKGGGATGNRIRGQGSDQSSSRSTHSKEIGSESGQKTEGHVMVNKSLARQDAKEAVLKGTLEGANCFVPSSAYTVGPQYVLHPDPSELDSLSDLFKASHTASDDDNDNYFSAESSSDSEDDHVDKTRQKQLCDSATGEKTFASPEVPGSHGILGVFWHTVGRLRDYISPRKATPTSGPRDTKDRAKSPDTDHQDCRKD